MSNHFSKPSVEKLERVVETSNLLNDSSVLEVIGSKCSVVMKIINDLQQNKGEYQAELYRMLHKIWPKSFSELSTTSETTIFKKLVTWSNIISVLPKLGFDDDDEIGPVFNGVYGVTPLVLDVNTENNTRDYLKLMKWIESSKDLVKGIGRSKNAVANVKHCADMISVIDTTKSSGMLIEAANKSFTSQLESLIVEVNSIRLETITRAQQKVEFGMPFVLGGGGSGGTGDDDSTDDTSHFGLAEEETNETKIVYDNNDFGGAYNPQRIIWDEVIIYVVGTIDNDTTTKLITTMRENSRVPVIVVDDQLLYDRIIISNANWADFLSKFKGIGESAAGFKSLMTNIGRLDTTSAMNRMKAIQVFKSIINKYMSINLISDVNERIEQLRETDNTFVETPEVIWKIVQELSLKGLLEFPEGTIKSQIEKIFENGTIDLKEKVESFRDDPLGSLLALDEKLTKVEEMREDWLRLCTTEYPLPSALKWQAYVEILRSWTIFVTKDSYVDSLQELVNDQISVSTTGAKCELLWERYRKLVHEFINKQTINKELVRVRNDNGVSKAFWTNGSNTGGTDTKKKDKSSSPNSGKGGGVSNQSKNGQNWKSDPNVLNEAQTRKAVEAGKDAANVTKTNSNNFHSVMVKVKQHVDQTHPGKKLPPEFAFCNNCGDFGSIRSRCTKCNPTVKGLMTKVVDGQQMIEIGGRWVKMNEVVFLDSCCEALLVLSNKKGIKNIRSTKYPIETVDGNKVYIEQVGELMGQKVLIDKNVKHSLLGLGALCDVLGEDRCRYEGTSDGCRVIFDDETLIIGQTTSQCRLPVCLKSTLLEALERVSDIIDEERGNVLKVMIARTRTRGSSGGSSKGSVTDITGNVDYEKSSVGLNPVAVKSSRKHKPSKKVLEVQQLEQQKKDQQKQVQMQKLVKQQQQMDKQKRVQMQKLIKQQKQKERQEQLQKQRLVKQEKQKQKRKLKQQKKKEMKLQEQSKSDSVTGNKNVQEDKTFESNPEDEKLGGSDVLGNDLSGSMPENNGITDSPIGVPLVDVSPSNHSLFPDLRSSDNPSPATHVSSNDDPSKVYIPNRLLMGAIEPADGMKIWLDESSTDEELVINLEKVLTGNANPIDGAVSMRVKFAFTFSLMLGKTSERSIRLLLEKQPELLEYFDIDDWKIAHKSFNQPVLMIATQRKTLKRKGNLHTKVPGEILHMDIVQLGGATKNSEVGKIQLALLVIDHYSRFECVVPFEGKSSDAISGAIDRAILLVKMYCARNKVAGAGEVREIRTDPDPLFKNQIENYQKKGIWLKLGGINYHEKISEANVQHTKDLISMICEQLPIEPPSWLVVLFLIGVVGWKNLIPKGTDRLSPYEKLTGLPIRYDRLVTAGTGQLGVTRRSSADMKKRPKMRKGEMRVDSMVSTVRGVLAIAIGPDYNNMNAIMVLPIKSDHMDATCANKLTSSPDFRSIPATAELFPMCFPRKELGALGRFRAANHWLTWEVQQMMANLRNSSVHNGVSDTEEEVVKENESEANADSSESSALPQSSEGATEHEHKRIVNPVDDEMNSVDDVITRVLVTMNGTNGVCMMSNVEQMVGSKEELHANEVSFYATLSDVKNDADEVDRAREECILLEIADGPTYKMFMTRDFIRDAMKDRKVNLGLDFFLNLKGSHYWSTPEEIKEAESYAREIVDEVIRDNTAPFQLLLMPLWCNDEQGDGSSSSSSSSNSIKCFYSSKPFTIREAEKLSDPRLKEDAKQAVKAEMSALINNGVIELVNYKDVPVHHRKHFLRSFTFIVQKYDSVGNYVKSKARCCANGAHQSTETYSANTSSPVCNRLLVMLMIQLSMRPGWIMKSFDIPCAFQQCDEPRELYCWVEKDLYRLRKTLYGSKHAAYVFFTNLRKLLVDNGWTPTGLDGGTYSFRKNNETVAVLCVHVDDVLCSFADQKVFDDLMIAIRGRFGEVEVEDASSFLGMRIEQNDDHIHVSMPGYLETLGDSIDIDDDIALYHKPKWTSDASPWDGTAMRPKKSVENDPDEHPVDQKKYMTLVGLLMYCVSIRSEIQPQVGYLSSNQQRPLLKHWKMAVRIAYYLRTTYTEGIRFNPIETINGKICLTGSADSSYNNDTGRTTCGGTIALGFNATPFGCFSKKMPGSGSSTEAEIKGMTYISSIIVWIRNVLMYVYLLDIDASIIECDNKPSTACMINSCVTPNLRHVNPKHWMCKTLYQRQEVIFAWVTTEQLLADTLTKPLSVKRWRTFKKRLLGMVDREHKSRELTLPNETKIYTDNLEPVHTPIISLMCLCSKFLSDKEKKRKLFYDLRKREEKKRKQYNGVEIIDVRDLEERMKIERDVQEWYKKIYCRRVKAYKKHARDASTK